MAQIGIKNLTTLAQLAQEIEKKRLMYMKLQALIEGLARNGALIEGEARVLNPLEAELDKAVETLRELESVKRNAEVQEKLTRLKVSLSGARWRLADKMLEDLEGEARRQDELLRVIRSKVIAYRTRIDELEGEISRARTFSAAIVSEERQLIGWADLVSQVERALDDLPQYALQYGLPIETLAEKLKEISDEGLQKLSNQINTEVERVRPFARDVDILLLKEPSGKKRRLNYTVMLRKAEPSDRLSGGPRGGPKTNIRDTRTLTKQDREEMSQSIKEITKAIDLGLARQFAIRRVENQAVAKVEPQIESQATGQDGSASDSHDSVQAEVITDADTSADTRQALDRADQDNRARHTRPFASPQNGTPQPRSLNDLLGYVGNLMYRLCIPEEIQRYLMETPSSVTITTNDLELPWELMCYRKTSPAELVPQPSADSGYTFLCLDRPVARMPMGRAFPRSGAGPIRQGKLRFLLIYADPTNTLPRASEEITTIHSALKDEWGDRIEIEVLSGEKAKGAELNWGLLAGRYDVIHYAGHASFNENEPDLSGLLLHDGEFYSQKIRRLLDGQPLVFLNACQSGRAANEKAAQQVGYFHEPAEGLASAFIYGGAGGCIGSLWPIYDRPAAEFAIEFYRQVLRGHMIGEAMLEARRKIRLNFPNEITWAAFVLYGDPTFRLAES